MEWLKGLLAIILLLTLGNSHASPANSHERFTRILQKHVEDGFVNYEALCKDDSLSPYLEQLAATNPDTIADDRDRLAFWLNTYNVFTLKIICDNYPVKSINELHFGGLYIGTILRKTIWHRKFITIAGQFYSLNNIEHDIIRKKFDDPRIHFALVCAAISCPPLRSEAYEGYKLHEQLDDQGRNFFRQKNKNYFETDKLVAHLSKILDWYDDDFGKNDTEILLYIAQFLPTEKAIVIRANPEKWKIQHTDYNWDLNTTN